jgi:hypothetical protein
VPSGATQLSVGVNDQGYFNNHGTILGYGRSWDTEEHARLSRDVLLGAFIPRLQALGVQLDPPQIFEVTAT